MPPRDHFKAGVKAHDEIIALMSEIAHASDRVAAVAGAALLDDSMGMALMARLVPLGKEWEDRIFSGATGPLSTFSAKMKLGYALGLFGPATYKDLDIIRALRNDFAHTAVPISFSRSDVAQKCGKLTTPGRITDDYHTIMILGTPFPHDSPKSLYISATRHIALRLIEQIRKYPPSRPSFPDALP